MTSPYFLKVDIKLQKMFVYQDEELINEYFVSTAKNGVGEINGSEKTPRGLHQIRAKIGRDAPPNTVFRERRPTGEICTPEMKRNHPNRDWIITRIMWLSGLEVGKNRLGNVDTMRRFVYIHGTPDDTNLSTPGSKGCIRMRNADIIELFDKIPTGTPIFIQE